MTWLSGFFIFGLLAVLSASAIWGLWWAIRGGQFSQFQQGANSIFDDDEPIGAVTDTFPDTKNEIR